MITPVQGTYGLKFALKELKWSLKGANPPYPPLS